MPSSKIFAGTTCHTFASRLVMAGVDLHTVKKLLGDHRLTMTERYAHFAPHYLKRAVDSLTLFPAQQPPEQPLAKTASS
jgi:site-specific recombinase XerD